MRIVFFIFLSIGVLNNFAQSDSSVPDIIESMNDSVDISCNFYNLEDSLGQFLYPSKDIYKNWNTKDIRYKEDSGKIEFDSIQIAMYGLDDEPLYIHPFNGIVTSHFGYRRYRFHYGTDIDLIKGDPVRAAFDGMVRINTYDKGFGNVVVLRHPNGLETIYAHLSSTKVDTNEYVKAGDIIGLGGNTGKSYGSHLHFEIRYLGKALDPESIIDFKTGKPIAKEVFLTDKNFKYLDRIKADKNAKFHYVRKGDTLSAIARRYKTSISKLCYYNGIKQNTILQIGQKIRIR